MKRINLLILIIGAVFILFSCSKDSTLAPDNQTATSFKAKKVHTHFTGICTPTTPPNPGDNAWYDDTDDARVTGVSVWVTEGDEPIDDITTELWGTAELTVDDCGGKWEMSWHGTQTLTSEGFRIVAHATGVGTQGGVEGLTARWKYTMDYVGGFPFDPFHPSFMYVIKGKITEALP